MTLSLVAAAEAQGLGLFTGRPTLPFALTEQGMYVTVHVQ